MQQFNTFLGLGCLLGSMLIMVGIIGHHIYHEYKSPHKNK